MTATMFTVLCRHAHSVWQITEAFLYVIEKSDIMYTWTLILLFLTFKENTISKLFYYIHIIEIPTNKGANSYKLKILKIGNYIVMEIR